MTYYSVVLVPVVAGLLAGIGGSIGRATVSAAPTARYEAVRNWPALPDGVAMGEAAGVAVDSHGHVFVFHRPGRGFDPAATEPLAEPAVLQIDGDNGRLIRAWGARTFLVPHGITIDRDDNVFCRRREDGVGGW
jgi:hypothetical protein